MDGDEEVPEHLRCRRTDGRRWRCRLRALDNVSFCELHLIQARRRQNKLSIPDSLKLRRQTRKRKAEDPAVTSEKKRKTGEGFLVGIVRMVMRKRRNGEREEEERKVKVGIKEEREDCMRTEMAAIAAMPVGPRKVRSGRKVGRRKEAAVAPMPVEEREFQPKKRPFFRNSCSRVRRSRGDLKKVPPKEVSLFGDFSSKVFGRKSGVTISVPKENSSSGVLPDHLRCRRNDGKQWRCSRPALENHYFCEVHHIQAVRRQYKLGVPDSLKLQRKPRNGSDDKLQQPLVKVPVEEVRIDKKTKKEEKRRKTIEKLLVELMQMVLKRQMERREKKEKKRQEEAVDITRHLPNGLMAISRVTSLGHSNNVGGHLRRKIGADCSSFLQWCFRSKNVEQAPVGIVKMFPYVRKAMGLGTTRKKICHHCWNTQICGTIRCSKCRKVFCRSCIKKCYSKLTAADVKDSCPVCRGKCSCIVCLPQGLKNEKHNFNSGSVPSQIES